MAGVGQSSDIYGILLDADTPRVLLVETDSGSWSLPHLRIDRRVFVADVDVTCIGMSTLLASDIIVLRSVRSSDFNKDPGHMDLIYVLENQRSASNIPPTAQWISRQMLADLSLTRPEQRQIIDNELRAVESQQVPTLRPPWAKPGWFKRAADWMLEQLIRQGYTLTGSVEQVRAWGISCLLRVRTDRGAVYFKVATALPLFGNEPVLMAAIAKRYPDLVPAPIAIEPDQRWMLVHDFGSDLRSVTTPERWETAIRRFGRLQLESANHIDELLAIGCLDRRLETLSSQIDPLLSDDAVRQLLLPAELENLLALAPRLKAMCVELAHCAVPFTLNHGDLHSGNITGQTLLIYDWTDACVAHPFLDLVTLERDANSVVPGAWEAMLAIYLNIWSGFESVERLQAMWKLAEPLGALHQAVSYQHILASQEPTSRQELMMGLPHWLRFLLEAVKRNFSVVE